MSKPFAVQIPIIGYTVAIINADSLEGALAQVHSEGFDLENANHEMQYSVVQLIGHQYKNAAAPDEHAIKVAKHCFDNVAN
jgi:hypothetical protein